MSQFDDLYCRFQRVLKAVDAANKDELMTHPPIEMIYFEHIPSDISLVDDAQELTFVPNIIDVARNKLYYIEGNVVCKDHTEVQHANLIDVLRKHEGIMISSDNALPPPAYGVVCDIDVQS